MKKSTSVSLATATIRTVTAFWAKALRQHGACNRVGTPGLCVA